MLKQSRLAPPLDLRSATNYVPDRVVAAVDVVVVAAVAAVAVVVVD